MAIEHENIIEDPPMLVGARFESSASAGVDGDPGDNSAYKAGAAYIPGPPQTEVFLPLVRSSPAP